MIRLGKVIIVKYFYILIDVFFICLSIYTAALFRRSTLPFPITFQNLFLDTVNPFRDIFLFWILITVFINNSYSLYETKRELVETIEIWKVIKSTLLSSLITIVIIYLLKVIGFPRTIVFFIDIFMIFSLSIWRIIKRILINYLVSKGYNNFNVLIIGSGRSGGALVKEINKRPGMGLHIVGFLDDLRENDAERPNEIKILGKINDFASIARKEFIHEVFIASHYEENVFLEILNTAKELGIAVRVVPQGFELMTGEFLKYNIGFVPILEYSEVKILRKQFGKRLFDFVISLILIVLVLPIFIIISIAIKIDSRGPVFYFSKRYGRSGHKFNMLKFRSMAVNADKALDKYKEKNEVDGPIFKIKKDPRITKIGAFLRRYSIDELPQLFNVFKGEMSLVGPRPLPINQVEKDDLRQLQRLEVKPGMTGLWQIRGRSDVSFSRLVRWDVWYINNWSFWLDLNILLQTIPVVLNGRGAY